MKKLGLLSAASICVVIGVIGLIIPIIPGIAFLILALVLFAMLSQSLRKQLERFPVFAKLFKRLDKGRDLPFWPQCQLTFWAIIGTVVPNARKDYRR